MSESQVLSLAIEDICTQHHGQVSPLLPILHEVQSRCGCIADEAVQIIAARLNLTRAEVGGVVSFYTDFKTQPPAGRSIKICRAEACQANGGREVWEAALAAAESHMEGAVEVEAVYCLGNCACGPSAQIDGQTLGRLNPQQIVTLVNALAKGDDL